MTWPTSWTRCWTETCSLLPLLTSGCSASALQTGGERTRHRVVPSGLPGHLHPRPPPSQHSAPRWECSRPSAHPAPCHTRRRGRRPVSEGSGLSHQTGSRRRAQRGCTRGPGGLGEALTSLHRAKEPPQGTFLLPRCIAESCLSLFIPCQQCVKRETSPGSRHRAGYLLSRSQPQQGLTAAKRRQGLSQFGSLQSAKEPSCFICCFSKCVSVRAACNLSGWKSLRWDPRTPRDGAGTACGAADALPDTEISLPLPGAVRMVTAVPKARAFVPVRLDHAAKCRLPSADTVPTQTSTPLLPG